MMNRVRFSLGAVGLLAAMFAGGCAGDLGDRVAAAQGARRWHRQEAFQTKVVVTFGDRTMVDGTFLFDTPVGRTRAKMADGSLVVFDGKQAWVSPAGAATPMSRFHALTWPYFIACPFKLEDPGAHLEAMPAGTLNGKPCLRARLTFDAGVGDAPRDWYVLHVDPQSGVLRGLGYVVTYGKTAGEAVEPHAVVFDDFVSVEGVLVPRRWTFCEYSEDAGIHGAARGTAVLSEMRFMDPPADAFVRPEGSVEAMLP